MPTYIKSKIPWLKIAVVVLVVVLALVIISFVFPTLGAIIVGGILGLFAAIYDFYFVHPTWLSVVTAVGITAAILILVTQRKYFFKQKVSELPIGTTAGALQGAPVQQQTFTNTPTVQQLVQDKDTEVTSS
jgi:hypothetical protein